MPKSTENALQLNEVRHEAERINDNSLVSR